MKTSNCQKGYNEKNSAYLREKARQIRINTIKMIYKSQSGHAGGSLSIVDILVVLFYKIMHRKPGDPMWPDRDRFVLSKGHSCPPVYAILADQGYFPESELWYLREKNHILQGHPDMRKTPGVDMTTGSLGQGLSAGVGMALAAKIDHKKYRVFVIIGDGECQEGQIWEAAMAASHFKLDNLIVILDYNGLQVDGLTREIISIDPILDKWKAFGWEVYTVNGHDFTELEEAFGKCIGSSLQVPRIIIANTIKGKGVSFMENRVEWHSHVISPEEFKVAISELKGK